MSFFDILSSDGEVDSQLDMENIDMSIDYSTPEELLVSKHKCYSKNVIIIFISLQEFYSFSKNSRPIQFAI